MTTIRQFIRGYAKGFAVTGEGTVLVDAGPRGTTKSLASGLSSCGIAPDSVTLIVITHAHPDHVGPLPELKELTGAPVMSHVAAAEALERGWGEPVVPRTAFARVVVGAMPKPRERNRRPFTVDIRIDRETDLNQFGIAGVVVPTSGHTPGSISVVLETGEAIIGDLVMKIGPGRPRLSFLSNDEEALRSSLRDLLDRGVHTFHLAHGGTRRREEVERLVR